MDPDGSNVFDVGFQKLSFHLSQKIRRHRSQVILINVTQGGATVLKAHVLWIAPCVLLCACPNSGFGSSVIFLLEQKLIAVGADSKTYSVDGADHGNVCKLFVAPSGIVFAHAGIMNGQDGTRFIELAETVLKDARTISEAADRFESIMRPRLQREASALRNALPDFYAEEVEDKPWYQVAFAHLAESGPQIVARTFEPITSRGRVIINVQPFECLDGCAQSKLGLGHFENIDEAFASGQRLPDTAEGRIRYLIGLEIIAAPRQVGPPISILTLKDTGVTWVDHGECK